VRNSWMPGQAKRGRQTPNCIEYSSKRQGDRAIGLWGDEVLGTTTKTSLSP
jgi:hypothetical protein